MRNLSKATAIVLIYLGMNHWLAGCRPECEVFRESPTYWRSHSEIVQLHGPMGLATEYSQMLADSASVSIAVIRPESKTDQVRNRLLVFLDGTSLYADKHLDLKCGKTFLQVGHDPAQLIAPSDCNDYACGRIYRKFGPYFESGVYLVFDLKDMGSTELTTIPITIRMDSVVVFAKKVVDLGRIEMASFQSNTAAYIP